MFVKRNFKMFLLISLKKHQNHYLISRKLELKKNIRIRSNIYCTIHSFQQRMSSPPPTLSIFFNQTDTKKVRQITLFKKVTHTHTSHKISVEPHILCSVPIQAEKEGVGGNTGNTTTTCLGGEPAKAIWQTTMESRSSIEIFIKI